MQGGAETPEKSDQLPPCRGVILILQGLIEHGSDRLPRRANPLPLVIRNAREHTHGFEAERPVLVPQGPAQGGRELLESGTRRSPARDETGHAVQLLELA